MSVYLSILSGAIKLFNSIAQALQQRHDELNGARAQTVATNDATTKELLHVAAPTSIADRDKLWDDNAAKFGSDSKHAGSQTGSLPRTSAT